MMYGYSPAPILKFRIISPFFRNDKKVIHRGEINFCSNEVADFNFKKKLNSL